MIISARNLFLNGAFSGPGAVAIEDGRIKEIFQGEVAADIRLTHGFLSPGLIDLHNNGAFGVDCATATPAAWELYITELAARALTSVLPTIITAEFVALHDAASRIAAAMARHGAILGLHLEGPFLAPARRGAHRADWLRAPDAAAIDALLAGDAMRRVLRVITLAPELPGALAAINAADRRVRRLLEHHAQPRAVQRLDRGAVAARRAEQPQQQRHVLERVAQRSRSRPACRSSTRPRPPRSRPAPPRCA